MIGSIISHYRIVDRLGEGGMGVVYKAEDLTLKRTVALKFLPATLAWDAEAKQRFIHEAQAASALDHINICAIHEIATSDDGQMFIVMAYYEGESLKNKIENACSGPLGRESRSEGPDPPAGRQQGRRGRLKIEDGIDIAIQIAEGLARAHEAGMVHRDIKPANIFITSHNEVKILDFGLAKLTGQTILTRTGSTLGTAAYMSPEQARGEPVDQRTDIWSLGVILYEMLAGKQPFESDFEQALIYEILNQHPKPIRSVRPDVPESLDQIVSKALAKEPGNRYQKAEELLSDLKAARAPDTSSGTIAATEAARRKRRKRRMRALVATGSALLLLAALVIVGLPLMQEQVLASNPKVIAVISFENQTGDKSQDHIRNVLQDAIINSLEQSKYLRVTTRERMADILKQMGKKNIEYIDNELGLEICRHEGAQLMAVGSFAKVGELYQTSLKLVDVGTLETAGNYSTKGKGLESLLEKQIDDLSREVSRGIGVSEKKTREQIKPVAEISTSSLEAYQLYLRGWQEVDNFNMADARYYLEMAVQKDSLFAAAWNALGWAYDLPDSTKIAHDKAISLAARATERERYYIALWADSSVRVTLLGLSGMTDVEFARHAVKRFPQDKRFLSYLFTSLGDPDERIAVLNKALELDPTYNVALNNLPYLYSEKGDWEKAIETLKRLAIAYPGLPNTYDDMGDIYTERGMHDEAIASYKRALAVKSDWYISADKIVWDNFLREDYESALRWTDSSAARGITAGNRARQMWERALIALWRGRVNEADGFLKKCTASLTQAGQHVEPGSSFLDIWIAYERHEFSKSHQAVEAWASSYRGQGAPLSRAPREAFVQMCHGFIDIAEQKLDSAAARLSKIDSLRTQLPLSDTTAAAGFYVRSFENSAGLLQSELNLAAGRIQEAAATRPRRDAHCVASGPAWAPGGNSIPGVRQFIFHQNFLPVMVDIVPQAHLALGHVDSALAAYERAVDASIREWPIFPRYHYRLAQLYEKKGLKQKAISEYEKFLKIWGKADPIYKEPLDARTRLANLKRQKQSGG